jgi:hypothetical protein
MPGYDGTVLSIAGFLRIHVVQTATGLSQGLVVPFCAFSREFKSLTKILDFVLAVTLLHPNFQEALRLN